MGKNYIIFTIFIFQNISRFIKSCTLNWQDARRRWEMRKKFNPKEEGNQRLGTPGSWWVENTKIDFMRTEVRARSCYIQLRIGSSTYGRTSFYGRQKDYEQLNFYQNFK